MSFFIVCGCLNSQTNSSLASTKYSAIQADLREEGTILSGNAPIGDAMPYDTFYYNIGNSTNYPSGYPPMNDSLKILLGTYHIESMPWRLQSSLAVFGVYKYPYTFENGPTILDVDKNGTAIMMYHNESINLKIGDEWKSPVIATRTENNSGSYGQVDINGTYRIINGSYTIRWDTTWTITNKGVFYK